MKLLKITQQLDVSVQYPAPTLSGASVWLITYADGDPVYSMNANALVASALNKGIDFFKIYTRKHIDATFLAKNAELFKQKRGQGYWLWKPYIILKTLESIPENDIVIYLDAGMVVRQHLGKLIVKAQEHDMVLFEHSETNRQFVKRDAFVLSRLDEKYRDSPSFQANYIILKNTPRVRAFIKRWQNYAVNPRMISDQPSVVGEYPDFKHHWHDQSLLNICYYESPFGYVIKEGDTRHNFFWAHRRRERDKFYSFSIREKHKRESYKFDQHFHWYNSWPMQIWRYKNYLEAQRYFPQYPHFQ